MIEMIVGGLLVLIVPGFILSYLFIENIDMASRSALAIGLNISLVALLSFMLTLISKMYGVKTFTPGIFIGSLTAASVAFSAMLILKKKKSIKH